ncbi:rod shape-determining protein MreD [Endozoicomonas sp. G2_1]|uniref:rod shape-determining protein MreD n=1 Tax=Endozoicomonas sp. G2_1 TaxID=2821091 RepID=UPI001ADC54B5|nr:rod shape-determining protein MreD [Endozoicomonas sp. G2_1]MBO9489612.1 rod shape-determining protein MreD [Endozoicomonas sp. G2_1]
MLAHNGIMILLTLVLALVASIVPMPLSVDAFRPDWLLMVLLYWGIALPNRVNIITAWLMGFILDVLLGSILGIHAAAMAIAMYIAVANFQKIRNFSRVQQALVVAVVTALYHLLVFWLQRSFNDVVFLPSYLYPVLSSVVMWFWLFPALRLMRRHFKIK